MFSSQRFPYLLFSLAGQLVKFHRGVGVGKTFLTQTSSLEKFFSRRSNQAGKMVLIDGQFALKPLSVSNIVAT